MHIVFHAHHADVTEALQQRAEQAVRKLATRLRGTTDASIRFVTERSARKVEIMLRVARRKPLVAEGVAPKYEGALAAAVERLSAHVAHVRAERARKRQVGAAPAAPTSVSEAGEQDDEFSDLRLDRAAPARRTAAS